MESSKQDFKFTTLPFASGTTANIFIHGYSAGHHLDDRRTLIESISVSMRNYVNIFVFWNSSHYSRLNMLSRSAVLAASRAHAAAAVMTFAADRAIHFTKIRTRASELGKEFLDHLGEYLQERHPDVKRVNLAGHSLGGRLLAHALMTPPLMKEHRFKIGDVMFMGAAIEVTPYECLQLKQRIEGRLINAYSPKDDTLLLNLGEDSLGRRRVDGFMNWPMTDLKDKFGHTDYWPNLTEILSSTCFAGFSGQDVTPYDDKAARNKKDTITSDTYLYSLLSRSKNDLLSEAIKHLNSSSWTNIKSDESDLAYAFTREFQQLSGNVLMNVVRGSGIRYTQALDMMADHFDLRACWHQCGSVVEAEEAILRTTFLHVFSKDHPMAKSPSRCAAEMPRLDYFRQVEALAKQLTVKSYFGGTNESFEASAIDSRSTLVASMRTSNFQPSFLWKIKANLQTASDEVTRLAKNAETAMKPAYSALIPAMAILYYARRTLGSEELM